MKYNMAPWETFAEHGARAASEAPYGEAFIQKCREKALEYNDGCGWTRKVSLDDIRDCIPLHYRGKVFDGIPEYRSFRSCLNPTCKSGTCPLREDDISNGRLPE